MSRFYCVSFYSPTLEYRCYYDAMVSHCHAYKLGSGSNYTSLGFARDVKKTLIKSGFEDVKIHKVKVYDIS